MDRAPIDEKRKDKIPYEYNKELFMKCDPIIMSENTGSLYDKCKNEFIVKLMGSLYVVKFPTGEILLGDYTEINSYPIKTLILRYLMNAKGAPHIDKNITYREVPGGNLYYNVFYGRCISRLAGTFGNRLDKFKSVLQKLGAEEVKMGDIAYKFEFVNNVYITFALWGGDEEFPPSAQILFDAYISSYFTVEDMAVIGDISIGKITKLSFAV
jgi:hypothetical protein